jgi:hypothetical protein
MAYCVLQIARCELPQLLLSIPLNAGYHTSISCVNPVASLTKPSVDSDISRVLPWSSYITICKVAVVDVND